jgi:hypothetical protein
MSSNATPVPDWLLKELKTGIQKLVSLSLESPPSADLIGATLLSWAETITNGRVFEEERDAPRFRAAFRTLQGRCRRWPAPADFLDALPRIESMHPAQRIESDRSREVGMRTLAEIAAKLKVEPVKPHTEVEEAEGDAA